MRIDHRTRVSSALAVLLLAPLGAAAVAPAQSAEPAPQAAKPAKAKGDKPVTVMSRNIYLGGDIFRPVQAANEALAAGKDLPGVLNAVAVSADATWANVVKTNFPVRAKLLAKEIKRAKPDLVGLQEVALWRTGPVETAFGTTLAVPNSTTVSYDFLALLQAELKASGAKYRVAVEGLRADVEAPAWDAAQQNKRDIRLTMRDVILRRVGSGKVLKSDDGIFTNNLEVKLGGVLPMNFDRGWQYVDFKSGQRQFRFINTHLEAAGSDLALAQATEIGGSLVKPKKTTIMVCDCNSDPRNNTVKPGDTVPHKAAYDYLTDTAGLTDEWLEWAPARKGWTSGLSELVNDATPAGFDHRIDLVLARTPSGEPLDVKKGDITGDELKDRDPVTGLWPSDHAGVVLKLTGLPKKKG
jgi:endonuclease/exonuclease/phosphatase family metal-dependent hydrolase